MKKVLILGSTGSIGVNALNVIRKFPDRFSIAGLTANSNISVLSEQIKEFKPQFVVIKDKSKAKELSEIVNQNVEIISSENALVEAAQKYDYDILIGAIVGFAGLTPTIEAIKRGKRIALDKFLKGIIRFSDIPKLIISTR